jgi:hypothetical protein
MEDESVDQSGLRANLEGSLAEVAILSQIGELKFPQLIFN